MTREGYSFLPDRSLRFVAGFPGAKEVRLAGGFSRWGAEALPLERRLDGRFEVVLPPLPVGLQEYKYIVDGAWWPDPAHGDRRGDGQGGENSTLFVSPPGLELGGMGALRLASLNLHTYQEREPLEKLAQIAEVFSALDIHAALLQEVGQHREEPWRHPNAGEELRRRLEARTGVRWYHEWRYAHVGFGVYDEGISLLSRIPLEGARELPLGGKTYRRIALWAWLSGRGLGLCSAHTSWPGDGAEEEIEALLGALPGGPLLLAGDFNAGPGAKTLRRLRGAGFEDIGARFGERRETFFGGHGPEAGRIDYHLLRGEGWRALGFCPLFHGAPVAGVRQPRVSDHTGLLGAYCPLEG